MFFQSPGRTRLNDYVRLYVRGGSGGQGSITYAGLGGDGGNVVIQCQQGASLQHFSLKQYRRVVGRHGGHFTLVPDIESIFYLFIYEIIIY